MSARDQIRTLQQGMARSIIGQEHVVERLILTLLANGNLLLEGLPGQDQGHDGVTRFTVWAPVVRAS